MSNTDESGQVDLFGNITPVPQAAQPLSPISRRILDAAAAHRSQEQPERLDFLHAILCQVGMPRKQTGSRIFERQNGHASMLLEAGRLWRRGGWVEQPLPYGTRPRLVMVHISGEAIRRRAREIEVGDSIREFLQVLDIDTNGGPRGGYTMFKKQMEALAACRLTLGMSAGDRDITINTQPIEQFEAWLHPDTDQRVMWPGVLTLSHPFYETLLEHAVPLDHAALFALKHSALTLDIYTWLAHRLCRVKKPQGVMLSWSNLKQQFGQEYHNPKDFKKEFRQAMRQVLAVYLDAKVQEVPGGLLMKPSLPPVPKTQVQVLLPNNG